MIFFSFWSNLIQSCPLHLQHIVEKALVLLFLRSLLTYLSISFGKKSEKSLEFWIQKSVRTLCNLASGLIVNYVANLEHGNLRPQITVESRIVGSCGG